MSALVLVVSSDETPVHGLAGSQPALECRFARGPQDVDDILNVEPVDLVVVGPSIEDPVSVVQIAHAVDRSLPVVVIRDPEDFEEVHRAIRFAPLIGEDVKCVSSEPDMESLADLIRERLEASRNRARYARTSSALQGATLHATPRARQYLGLLLEQLPVGVITLDENFRMLGRNPAALQILAPSDTGMAQAPITEQFEHPDKVERFLRAASAVEQGGTKDMFTVVSDGDRRYLELMAAPAGARSTSRRLLLLVQDVTATVVSEHERARAEAALRFQKQLLETESEATIDGILVVSEEGRILYANRRFAEMWGIQAPVLERGQDEEARESVLSKLADPESFVARIRYLYDHPEEDSRDELHLLDGRVFDRYSTPLRDPEVGLFARAWYFRDITADKRLEADLRASRERFALLAEASKVFSASLDGEAILRELANYAVAGIADWCAVDVVAESGEIRRLTATHRDPGKRAIAEQMTRYPPRPPHYAVEVIRTGRPMLVPSVPPEQLRDSAHDEEHARLMREIGRIRSGVIVPLTARGRVIGTLTLASTDPDRVFGEDDLRLAEDLALRAGLAVENARLFAERSHQAQTLQRALLPPELPAVPGMEVAARYLPGGEGVEVGGDFYDVFHTDGPRWVAVVGDVCGKGVEAAVLTALCRHTIRTVAGEGGEAEAVFRTLNRAIYRDAPETTFATVCYTSLTLSEEKVGVRLASAGHPPPFLLRAGGHVEFPGVSAGPLGFFEDFHPAVRPLLLGPGDLLVLYTDGVVEARRGSELFGEERLTRLIRACTGASAEVVADRIVDEVLGFREGRTQDDIALVALRVRPQNP